MVHKEHKATHTMGYTLPVAEDCPRCTSRPVGPLPRALNESQIHVAIASRASGSSASRAVNNNTSAQTTGSGVGSTANAIGIGDRGWRWVSRLPTRLASVAATATQLVAYICVLTREIIFYFDHLQRIEKCPLISLGLCEGFMPQ